MKQVYKILLVDDDPTSMYLVQSILEDMQIVRQVATAANGKEALDFIETHCLASESIKTIITSAFCPELILLDINMPLMDGFEFLEACKDKHCFKGNQVKVVMLSSSSSMKDLQKAKTYGVTHYLVKPLTKEKLLVII